MTIINKLKISAYLALLYGVGLACFETFVNWAQWQWWPFWLVDYVAAVFLIMGAIFTLQGTRFGSKFLCAGWGFTLGMMWMSLAGNISDGTDPNRAARVFGLYLGLITFSMIVSLAGLGLALVGKEKAYPPNK